MEFFRKLWSIRNEAEFRRKIVEMATDFFLEASVLVSVLGVLESAIAAHGVPSMRVFSLSVSVGALFFIVGCIIQADDAANRKIESEHIEEKEGP